MLDIPIFPMTKPPYNVYLVLGQTEVGQACVASHAVQQDVATSFGRIFLGGLSSKHMGKLRIIGFNYEN